MSSDTSTTQTLSAPRWVFHLAEQVAHEHGLDLDDVTTFRTHNVGGRAKRHARQHLMYLIRNAKMLSGATPSYPMIAYWLGGLHHTTVMHGVRAHETRMKARAEAEQRDAA